MNELQPSPAGMALALALRDDPFYATLVADLPAYADTGLVRLGHYFDYALREGKAYGRVRHADADQGAAIWLLPEEHSAQQSREATKKQALQVILGQQGFASYAAMIAFMEQQTPALLPQASWYLSILGVDPRWQGHGIGAALLRPTLAEIDAQAAPCYLETFSERSIRFYRRCGFAEIAAYQEPLTAASYWVLLRQPRSPIFDKLD